MMQIVMLNNMSDQNKQDDDDAGLLWSSSVPAVMHEEDYETYVSNVCFLTAAAISASFFFLILSVSWHRSSPNRLTDDLSISMSSSSQRSLYDKNDGQNQDFWSGNNQCITHVMALHQKPAAWSLIRIALWKQYQLLKRFLPLEPRLTWWCGEEARGTNERSDGEEVREKAEIGCKMSGDRLHNLLAAASSDRPWPSVCYIPKNTGHFHAK